MSVFVLSEAAFCPLLMAQLVVSAAAWQRAGMKSHAVLALLAGVIAGAATLVRPSWLLFVPLSLLLGLLTLRNLGQHVRFGVCALVGLALVMMPWWLRNYRATGHFVATTLQVGASLYDGWNPHATGASEMSFVPEFAALERGSRRKANRSNIGSTAACALPRWNGPRRIPAGFCNWPRSR